MTFLRRIRCFFAGHVWLYHASTGSIRADHEKCWWCGAIRPLADRGVK